MFNKFYLRAKTDESYPPFLWIICFLMGIIGAYYSRIGSLYYVITDSILLISAWLIFIGLSIIFLSINDYNNVPTDSKVGIYSAINHPRMFGEYLLIIGLNLQSINIIIIVILVLMFTLYHKWKISSNWNYLFRPERYFRFNLWKMNDNEKGIIFSNSFNQCKPYLIYSTFYILIMLELRNRTIGRSIVDVFMSE
jgi:protein-S-isoprenylcysteine O-methyltransferase Ste14